jgi:gas vesicle protein
VLFGGVYAVVGVVAGAVAGLFVAFVSDRRTRGGDG